MLEELFTQKLTDLIVQGREAQYLCEDDIADIYEEFEDYLAKYNCTHEFAINNFDKTYDNFLNYTIRHYKLRIETLQRLHLEQDRI